MEWRPGNSGALGRHGVEHALPVVDCCNNQYTTAGESNAFLCIISCDNSKRIDKYLQLCFSEVWRAYGRLRLVHAKTTKELKAAVVSSSVVGV